MPSTVQDPKKKTEESVLIMADIEHDLGCGRESQIHVSLTPAVRNPAARDGPRVCPRSLREHGRGPIVYQGQGLQGQQSDSGIREMHLGFSHYSLSGCPSTLDHLISQPAKYDSHRSKMMEP